MTRRTLTALAVLAAGGCVKSGTPRPVAPVLEQVLPATPDVVYAAALKAVGDEGLPVRISDFRSGRVETEYVDIASYYPLESSQYPDLERLVRFRLIAIPNPQGPGTKVSIFAVYQPFRTGYSAGERNERAIPRDHPGMTLARKLEERTKRAVGGG